MPTSLGGYSRGYAAVPCFWGTSPGSLIAAYLTSHEPQKLRVLDIGAGEGKNAAAFARRGATVDAIECSSDAIKNGKLTFSDVAINWIEQDAMSYSYPSNFYDVVVCYGLIHCLRTAEEAERFISKTQASLKIDGVYILASFNDGSHDLSAHPGFKPLLMSHAWFIEAFNRWQILVATNTLLHETHPDNGIPHFHSMSRLMAKRR
jgi:2-polyprenyl-3-methyl-5-hydroxy-6-metoxy-1,4-benzoquinol methylase